MPGASARTGTCRSRAGRWGADAMAGQSDRTDDPGRHETGEERADRRWSDLLQELRVAQTGVQILFGFLLTVVFQQRFAELSDTTGTSRRRGGLRRGDGRALVGPVAMHRLLTGRRLKPETVVWASRMTVLGLFLLLCTMALALLLVLRLAVHDAVAAWLAGAMVLWFALCWLVVPLWARHRSAAR